MTEPARPIPVAIGYTTAVWSPQEVIVGLGGGRINIPPLNAPTGEATFSIEWTSALSMSPTTARLLRNQLTWVLERYESAYGAIPFDPRTELSQVDNVVTLRRPNAPVPDKPTVEEIEQLMRRPLSDSDRPAQPPAPSPGPEDPRTHPPSGPAA